MQQKKIEACFSDDEQFHDYARLISDWLFYVKWSQILGGWGVALGTSPAAVTMKPFTKNMRKLKDMKFTVGKIIGVRAWGKVRWCDRTANHTL